MDYAKEQPIDTGSNLGKSQDHRDKKKTKPDTEDFILYDSIYMKFLEKAKV